MHPIVINYQQRQQYILIFVVTLVASFGLGFWFGYHSNPSDEVSTVLPQLENQSLSDGSYTPDWSGESDYESSADAESRTDATNKPDAKPDIKPDTKPVPVVKPAAVPVPVKPVVKPVVTVPPVVTPKPPAPAPVAPVVNKPVPVAPVTTPAVTPVVVPSPTPVTPTESITNSSLSAEAANTVYTVQAGVFENRDNAMKLVNELNNRGFDAYVDEVVTGSGDSKFNVRFGRHSDRELVQRKLTRFKQLYTTSAYIIVLDQ